MYPLYPMFKIWCCDGRVGILTNKVAGYCLVLLSVITLVRYGGKHIELDLICDGEPRLLDLGRHYQVGMSEEEKGTGGDTEV